MHDAPSMQVPSKITCMPRSPPVTYVQNPQRDRDDQSCCYEDQRAPRQGHPAGQLHGGALDIAPSDLMEQYDAI